MNDYAYVFIIVIGLILIVISFLMQDKTNNKDDHQEYKEDDSEVEYDNVMKETNDKILELNDYAGFVKNELESKHKELLFLYQLINEKETKIKKISSDIKKDINIPVSSVEATQLPSIQSKSSINEQTRDTKISNSNQKIIDLTYQGYEITDIAKKLGIGQGEVKLVLDLYK